MQTFLPYPPEIDEKTGKYSFSNSAKVLDNKRLGKERVEGMQILQLLCGKPSRWKNHPAVLQWKGYEFALRQYIFDMCGEWVARGFVDTIADKIKTFNLPNANTDLPPWMGNSHYHSSHRSRLLFKGYVDSLLETLHLDFGISKPHKWLTENKFPKANSFTTNDADRLSAWMYNENMDLTVFRPNHYDQFKWKQRWNDRVQYYWPVKKS